MTTWILDPGVPADDARQLVDADGEYAVAIARLAKACVVDSLPDDVLLTIYAYEVLERMRAHPDREAWVIPLWPAATFAAADIPAHPGREIEAMLPTPTTVRWVAPDAADVARIERRLFGRPLLDPGRYATALARIAETRDWVRA